MLEIALPLSGSELLPIRPFCTLQVDSQMDSDSVLQLQSEAPSTARPRKYRNSAAIGNAFEVGAASHEDFGSEASPLASVEPLRER